MIVLNRTQFILATIALLVMGVGGGLAIAHRSQIRAWITGDTTTESSMAGMQEGSGVAAAEPAAQRRVLYWYDPMHPSYRSDKPGIAPDCGMDLVPKYADEMEAMQDMPPGSVMLSAEKQQLIGVRTTEAWRSQLARTLRATGRVEMDETRISRVHTKVEGWVEKVYGDFVGKLVRKGQPLFTLYSPQLVSTQEEYLIARRGQKELSGSPYANVSKGADALLRAARQRLALWDISEEQIRRLEETGEVQRTLTILSPVSGFVQKLDIFPQSFVTPGKVLYEIADLSRIWVHVDIYEFELPYVRTGQQATMRLSYFPGKTFRGKVTYLYPTVDLQTRTAQVRIEFRNPNFDFKPGMFADVDLEIDYGVHTLVPSEAVLDSGMRQIVFIARGGGIFEPREVEVGPVFDGQAAILRGVEPGEIVVSSGNFLLDSESKLSAATGGVSHQH